MPSIAIQPGKYSILRAAQYCELPNKLTNNCNQPCYLSRALPPNQPCYLSRALPPNQPCYLSRTPAPNRPCIRLRSSWDLPCIRLQFNAKHYGLSPPHPAFRITPSDMTYLFHVCIVAVSVKFFAPFNASATTAVIKSRFNQFCWYAIHRIKLHR